MTKVFLSELIAALLVLQSEHGNVSVYLQGKDNGLDDVVLENIVCVKILRNFNSEEHEDCGLHEDLNAICDPDVFDDEGNLIELESEIGIVICRQS